jgi:hypothetical protein
MPFVWQPRGNHERTSSFRVDAVTTAPALTLWSVPREWVGERCFVMCTGESIGPQASIIKRLNGRFIAVKHAIMLRPEADVMFLAGEPEIELHLLKKFRGAYVVMRRGKDTPGEFPDYVKRVTRTKDHEHLCDLPNHVCGLDSGTSAIDLAYKFGATEIVLLGYDMQGGHFCKHPLQNPPTQHFTRHLKPLEAFAADAKAKGVRIINASPSSAVTVFEKRPLESFL